MGYLFDLLLLASSILLMIACIYAWITSKDAEWNMDLEKQALRVPKDMVMDYKRPLLGDITISDTEDCE